MKPHIRKVRKSAASWYCVGHGHMGMGGSPKKAYDAWLMSCARPGTITTLF